MGFLDKLLGREKKASDETMDKPEMKQEGMGGQAPAAEERTEPSGQMGESESSSEQES